LKTRINLGVLNGNSLLSALFPPCSNAKNAKYDSRVDTDSWSTIAVPLLERLATSEISDPQGASLELVEECNSSAAVLRTLASLIEDGFIAGGSVYWPLGAGKPTLSVDVLRLTPKGRRAIRQWPPEQSVESFVEVIKEEILSLPDGEARSRLQSLLNATLAVGTNVLSGIFSNLLNRATGL
jgi:hypothetical protein